MERFYITPDRIIMNWNLRRLDILYPVPWIHGVDVLRLPVTLELDMSGNLNIIPMTAIHFRLIKILHTQVRMLGIGKLPRPIQILPVAHWPRQTRLLHRVIVWMI